MPLKKCSSDGKSGWKWENSGKCYVGPGGKKKAIKQGLSYDQKAFSQEIASALESDNTLQEDEDIQEIVTEILEDPIMAMTWLEVSNEIITKKHYAESQKTKTVRINASSERAAMKTAETSNSGYKAASATPIKKGSKVYEVVLIKK